MHPAKQFFIDHYNNKKMYIHSRCVLDCCLEMADTHDNKDVFIIASWIHDMGKKDDKPNHHLASIKYLDLFIQQYPAYQEIYDTIKDCIINHRTQGQPVCAQAKLFQKADKRALTHKDWLIYKGQKST